MKIINRIKLSQEYDDKNACNVKYTEALKTINYIFPWDRKDNGETEQSPAK